MGVTTGCGDGACVLPPPFPFKPFVLSAGVFKLRVARFVIAILIGRATRFLIEGWLAIRFGEEAGGIIRRKGLTVLAVVGIIVFAVVALKLYRARRGQPAEINEAQPESVTGQLGSCNLTMRRHPIHYGETRKPESQKEMNFRAAFAG